MSIPKWVRWWDGRRKKKRICHVTRVPCFYHSNPHSSFFHRRPDGFCRSCRLAEILGRIDTTLLTQPGEINQCSSPPAKSKPTTIGLAVSPILGWGLDLFRLPGNGGQCFLRRARLWESASITICIYYSLTFFLVCPVLDGLPVLLSCVHLPFFFSVVAPTCPFATGEIGSTHDEDEVW